MADPLSRMLLTTAGFRAMATTMRAVADEVCDGRLVGFQEGGYSASYTPFCTFAIVQALAGVTSDVREPWTGSSELAAAERAHSSLVDDAIAAARETQGRFWRL
jgi:acetoin utilization deacetylase AcuC-like enzyme